MKATEKGGEDEMRAIVNHRKKSKCVEHAHSNGE